jgi:acetolactate synthase-1/2/3 large subunit
MPTGGAAVLDALATAGVTHVFGIPGVHSLPVYDALPDRDLPRHVLVRHEQAAGFMADGYARASGRPGVCLLASGPGATNAITAVAEAWLDSSPVVVVAAGIPSGARGRDGLHEIEQAATYAPITKWRARVERPEAIGPTLWRALREATTGRPRPVYVELPFDVLAGTFAAEDAAAGGEPPPAPAPEPAAIDAAVRLLARAERPLVVAGGGAVGAAAEIAALAERLAAPVVTTMMGRGVVADDHPLSGGFAQDLPAASLLAEADVVYAAGCRFSDSSFWHGRTGVFRIPGRLVHVDVDAREIGKIQAVACGIVGDARAVTAALCARLSAADAARRAAVARRLDALARARADALPVSRPGRLGPSAAMRELVAAAPPETLFACDAGNNTWWAQLFCRVRAPRSLLAPAGNWTMGFAVPAAIGAKVARPDRPVVAIVGDGGFQMTSQELATAAASGVAVAVVVLNDGCHGAIRNYQRWVYGGRFAAIDVAGPDLAALASALGVRGTRIERPGELADAVAAALDTGLPALFDVRIDAEEEIPAWLLDRFYRS